MNQLHLLCNFTSGYYGSMFALTYCITLFDTSYLPRCWPMPLRFKLKIDVKFQKLRSLSFDVNSFCNVDKKLISNGG